MSRSGDSEDLDPQDFAMWRGQVASYIRGKRGQQLLRDMATALDAMPEKWLAANVLEEDGAHCALGVVGAARGINLGELDPEDSWTVSEAFNIAEPLAKEIVFINDEQGWDDDGEKRRLRVRKWVADHIKPPHDDQPAVVAREGARCTSTA